MLIVKVGNKKGDIEKALKKYKNKVRSTKLVDELRKREYFEKPSETNRKAKRKAIYINKKYKQDED